MFLRFGFTKVPNNMILMSHRCTHPYYCITLCVHVLQRVGGPGEPRALLLRTAALPFDQQLCVSVKLPHCLEPSKRKLLTPPTPPPSKK